MSAALRILLVEDDADQAALYTQVLKMAGFESVTAPDADAANTLLSSVHFDLVIADWDLPGVKGDDLIAEIKRAHPDQATLLYSNHTFVRQAADLCGADACLRKSDGIVRLREVVSGLVGR